MPTGFFKKVFEELDRSKTCRLAIPMAEDEACAYAVIHAVNLGILSATLIGNSSKIHEMYKEIAHNDRVTIIEESDPTRACQNAVRLVREGHADILMKGLVPTSTLLKAVLNSKEGLKKNPLLSHLLFFETTRYPGPGLRLLSDAAINIAPDADTLTRIVENAVEAFAAFESRPPLVALLSANEKISEKVPSTLLAKEVCGRFAGRSDAIVEGPISLDLAISQQSATIKKYEGRIRGNADILIVPRIETGNVLYKSLHYFAGATMGGLVFGAHCPVVLTSRADENETKFNSLLLGVVLWQRGQSGRDSKEASLASKSNQG